jgi:hypothetical protein
MLNREAAQRNHSHGAVDRALELVHVEVCGPTRTPSVSRARYCMLLVDDYMLLASTRDRCFKH